MGKRLIVAALMTLLAGCASTEPLPERETNYGQNNAGAFNTAVYVNTQTGDIKHCDNTLGSFWWSGPIAFGKCKSKLEAMGYVREDK